MIIAFGYGMPGKILEQLSLFGPFRTPLIPVHYSLYYSSNPV
jgi:hypothetical protein